MTTAVDTNAFLALLYDDEYADASEAALRHAYREGAVVVTPVVYVELAADGRFDSAADLDRFLEDFSVKVVDPSREARFTAGDRFREYVDRRPDGIQCPACGETRSVDCEACGESISPRQHIAADFLIGAHAVVDCDGLVTFDEGFYSTYFPSLAVSPN
ncbi:PIN domain-containing protein [Halorubrum lipolyticum]|uniref:Nucleic acid-binding protein n=1 Tax=Halorubrum lipolyticum DSM 21995 TaxID=1227482 RepID=M0NVE3_9EURY|nr:PIN domain-containing protein [Halorubrum lipolyticum]EMA61786.1 nucleic acid-binding protein [Halorubrum lipolyticum DSM 21995]